MYLKNITLEGVLNFEEQFRAYVILFYFMCFLYLGVLRIMKSEKKKKDFFYEGSQ